MKIVLKKSFTWFGLFISLAALLLFLSQPAAAQTEPETTPTSGYPPPATATEPGAAYPDPEQPTFPSNDNPTNGAYAAPTAALEATSVPAIVGESAATVPAEAAVPIGQSAQIRNRAILWAGFLITLILFLLAVYGAMLMYTRPRN